MTGADGGAAAVREYHVREHHPEQGTLLGFWIYL
ncbi:MAG TPA: cytochrome o ubiquinol oxidase subunit III, partial [Massilia sp.]|nr:cytochrome o ubiquinol oxidase subunit III [Massilia sp.]